jgi:hypothetical protein
MRHFALKAHLHDFSADEAFDRISRFDQFVGYSDVIAQITVTTDASGATLSSWEVNFHDGILRWTERDVLDVARRSITFEQVKGDMHAFEGSWIVSEDGGKVTLEFRAAFDLGMPSIADVLDPIAVEALEATIGKLMIGLFGATTEIEVQQEPAPAA